MIWLFYPEFSFIWLLIQTEREGQYMPLNWYICEWHWFEILIVYFMPLSLKKKQKLNHSYKKGLLPKEASFRSILCYTCTSWSLFTWGWPWIAHTVSFASAYHNTHGWISLVRRKFLLASDRPAPYLNGRSHGYNLSSTPGHAELDALVILQ